MNRCNLRITATYPFNETEYGSFVPVIPVKLHRRGMRKSIDTVAVIDTGFDKGLLISREVRDLLFIVGDPDREESLGAGEVEIPCEVFVLDVKVFDRWFRVEGFAPLAEGFETIVGRELLALVNVCIRGPVKECVISIPD